MAEDKKQDDKKTDEAKDGKKGVLYSKSDKKIAPIATDKDAAEDSSKDEKSGDTTDESDKSEASVKTDEAGLEENVIDQSSKQSVDAKGKKLPVDVPAQPSYIDQGQYHIKVSKDNRKRYKRKPKGSQGLLVIILILIMFVVGGAFVYFYYAGFDRVNELLGIGEKTETTSSDESKSDKSNVTVPSYPEDTEGEGVPSDGSSNIQEDDLPDPVTAEGFTLRIVDDKPIRNNSAKDNPTHLSIDLSVENNGNETSTLPGQFFLKLGSNPEIKATSQNSKVTFDDEDYFNDYTVKFDNTVEFEPGPGLLPVGILFDLSDTNFDDVGTGSVIWKFDNGELIAEIPYH